MKKVCFINGSSRKNSSTSLLYIKYMIDKLNKSKIDASHVHIDDFKNDTVLFDDLLEFDVIVFTFGLYVDSLPAHMVEFLCSFEEFLSDKEDYNIDAYGICNCGFLEGTQNNISLDILENFSTKVGLNWLFGIGIGAGEFGIRSKSMPLYSFICGPILSSLTMLKESLESPFPIPKGNRYIQPRIPKGLYIKFGNKMWAQQAKKYNTQNELSLPHY